MKTYLILAILSVLSVLSVADAYQGKPLSQKRFAKFYRYFKTRLYTDSAGKVYNLADPRAKNTLAKDADSGSTGTVTATVTLQKSDSKAVAMVSEEYQKQETRLSKDNHLRKGPPVFETIKVTKIRTWPCCLDGVELRPGERFTGLVVAAGDWYDPAAKRTLPPLRVLTPVTKAEFMTYLKAGNKLYYYKKVVTPAKYRTCKTCNGFGQIKKNGKTLDYIKCPTCHGKRKLEISPRKIEYIKKLIK